MANDDVKVTAKRGATVRLVHRPTEGAWKLWEMGTNKMVAKKAFPSRDSALAFAKTQGWNVNEGRQAPKAPAPTMRRPAYGKLADRPAAGSQRAARKALTAAGVIASTTPRSSKKPKPSKLAKQASRPERKRAKAAATAPAGTEAPATVPADDNGKRLNMLDPNGGDKPVARPTNIRPVPKPKDQKKKEAKVK